MNDALSPLDGRYRAQLADVRACFSEQALMRARCEVEIAHALHLDPVFGPLSQRQRDAAQQWLQGFGEREFAQIKRHEATLRHDVKAVEVTLRETLDLGNPNRIHFGLTSEDVNNLAWSLCARQYRDSVQLPSWHRVLAALVELAERWAELALPARTHGQHASPTTAGKEIAVFIGRLLPILRSVRDHRFVGKLNGATGNYSAALVAAPHVDWRQYERALLAELGLDANPATTQIEDHGSLARWFDSVRAANNVAMDLCQDMWLYISYGYVAQRAVAGEVGSSTMPHKINPIRFENAEGNLQLSNALLVFLSDKLSRSRLQRDLSDSTTMRNMGVAMGHHHLALLELLGGLGQIDLDAALCQAELGRHPELLSEAVQSVLRTIRRDDVYSELKALTRGQSFDDDALQALLSGLPDDAAAGLRGLTPQAYVGDALRICREVVAMARLELP